MGRFESGSYVLIMDNDTIAAISTPVGIGGIGIIKISGKNAKNIVSLIFRKSKSKNTKRFLEESHKVYHGHIVDPDSKKAIDEVLLTVMLAPHSYTGEDVVEINVHSGIFLLKTILNIVLTKGARIAEPGEFTKRAFINGRIDLTQAEAIIDIINAKSIKALEIANAQVDGELRNHVEKTLNILNNIFVKIEAAIDFPDAEECVSLEADIIIIENVVINKLNELISGYNEGHVIREGIKLVIAGRPNVGKSSLMNSLLQKERAIVTSIPGTTRDVIEETIIISGIPAIISDTAGLHDTIDPVESIGIKKAREQINNSDVILFVIDASSSFNEDDRRLFESIKNKLLIVVYNKIDLLTENHSFEICEEIKKYPMVKVSSLYNTGMDCLKENIKEIVIKDIDYSRLDIVPNLRQKIALEKCLENMVLVSKGIKDMLPYELISIDLAEAIESLNQVVGNMAKPDLLDQIFSRFCIGK
ncbi:MAG: tRNA uridine-5-carboxymethylaminomethyl(34) synthesis GTPase MnmE [Proteobacteria bacterium]|nr:tRNA uridine-5-carboxymethylaminomethyl(34) synthesis GTPase MnmE [Pseudomonadota bacterium]